ncbi:MAG: hypothetical protein V2I67_06025 [Thermoanaerobaculales bacterium]|jgi:hypothetical protein|nr:hypothetical protein [Thermoanaerobaculales bacterium]
MNLLKLVNLDCPSCGSAMSGEGFDTIFFCSHCGAAAVLDEDGLQTVEGSALMPAPGRRADTWRPAWRLEVDVRVEKRFRSDGRETPGWEGRRLFFVPAFDLPLGDVTRLARALSDTTEARTEVPREPIHGGTLAHEDAMVLVRHLLVGDEVRRSDMLASVEVIVNEVGRSLVAIPFEAHDGRLRCAVTGVAVGSDGG